MRDFSGFGFETDSRDLKNKLDQIQPDYFLNDFITLCNLLCISNEGSLVYLTTILITYLSDLNLIQVNIFENESKTDSETELYSNNARNTQNDGIYYDHFKN